MSNRITIVCFLCQILFKMFLLLPLNLNRLRIVLRRGVFYHREIRGDKGKASEKRKHEYGFIFTFFPLVSFSPCFPLIKQEDKRSEVRTREPDGREGKRRVELRCRDFRRIFNSQFGARNRRFEKEEEITRWTHKTRQDRQVIDINEESLLLQGDNSQQSRENQ